LRSPSWTVGVIGAGWSGLAAAVTLQKAGARVTLWDMAPQAGGRARSRSADRRTDNGQHILIGAYRATLALMAEIGVDPESVLSRLPLHLTDALGRGLQARSSLSKWPELALLDALMRHPRWPWRDRLRTLTWLTQQSLKGFQCDASLTVSELTSNLPLSVRRDWIDPLCVAALNTPSSQASATVFLTVLRAVSQGGPGATDLLLPKAGLNELLPGPALRWLEQAGSTVHLGTRVHQVTPMDQGWQVNEEKVDQVVVATTAKEAARLTADIHPEWSTRAAGLPFSPITTVYARGASPQTTSPMVMLDDGPAQFAFDLGRLGSETGLWSIVSSAPELTAFDSARALAAAMTSQLDRSLQSAGQPSTAWTIESVQTDKRATLLCHPGLIRPGQKIAQGCVAAGDYIDGPYPSTLEGAVLAGRQAAAALIAQRSASVP
jgi:hydroxysqualene dehydroxylase